MSFTDFSLPKIGVLRKCADDICKKHRVLPVTSIIYVSQKEATRKQNYITFGYYSVDKIGCTTISLVKGFTYDVTWRTFLHELAHHICWRLYQYTEHGPFFFAHCEELGGAVSNHLLNPKDHKTYDLTTYSRIGNDYTTTRNRRTSGNN